MQNKWILFQNIQNVKNILPSWRYSLPYSQVNLVLFHMLVLYSTTVMSILVAVSDLTLNSHPMAVVPPLSGESNVRDGVFSSRVITSPHRSTAEYKRQK